MTQMNGSSKTMRAGDMIMRDANGVCCSILYGQDHRSPISSATTQVLYVAYAPIGVAATTVEKHLREIEAYLRYFSPEPILRQHRLISA